MSTESKRISRRDFLRGASLVTAAGVLSACVVAPPGQPAPQQAEQPAQPAAQESTGAEAPAAAAGVTVQYWVNWGNYAPAWDTLKGLDSYKEIVGENIGI
jgi:hypothetical protein